MRRSNCCDAPVTNDESNEGFGRCMDCKEICEYYEDEIDEEETCPKQ